jgi:hypothetical protein
LKEIDMSTIKVAATATSHADPCKVFSLLKDPVTWPLWSIERIRQIKKKEYKK